jgi:hypothetical protein
MKVSHLLTISVSFFQLVPAEVKRGVAAGL